MALPDALLALTAPNAPPLTARTHPIMCPHTTFGGMFMFRARHLAATALLLACSVVAACSSPSSETAGGTTASAGAQAGAQPPAGPPSAADLMTSTGCTGGLIEPQLYTREVGRCMLNGTELDVATFDSNEQRDQWAAFARDMGATVSVRELWAVSGFGAAGPEAFAASAP